MTSNQIKLNSSGQGSVSTSFKTMSVAKKKMYLFGRMIHIVSIVTFCNNTCVTACASAALIRKEVQKGLDL